MCNLTKQQLEYNTVAYLKMYGKENNALACVEDVWMEFNTFAYIVK